MKINVTENKISIKEEQILNENEYNIHKIQFDFSSEYTDDLVKVALFSIDNHTYKKIISNNECDIPPEVLTQRGYSILGVYAYKTEQDTLVLRYSPSPTRISVYDGSYKADAENSEPITPSEIEQYQQILQNSLQQFQNQYNALVEETEGDIQAIEDELQRKVDEGYFDGEDGFSPIAKVIQKSNGATIEIEDKNGKTTADVLNGEDGYTPVRGIDYWTEEDKQEVEEEATQQIEGKIEEYNENAAEKLNQYNQNSVQKTNDYNTNAEQKMSAYNTNATEKTSTYNSNATEKFNDYNSNAEQKETNYNTNASSKLSEYNSNAETKKSAYDENATQKTNSFNTNATNKLTEYNTNHTEKMSAYNSNSTQKLNAFNENATQKTEDFDAHTEEIQDNIEKLQTENARLKATLPTTTGEGQDITLDKTAEMEFIKPPLPMGNSEQVQYSGKNKFSSELEQNAWNNSDGTTTVWSNQYIRSKDFVEVKYNTTYTLNYTMLNNDVKNGNILLYDENKSFINSLQTPNNLTVTTSATTKYLKFNFYAGAGANINDMSKLQLEEGSTATSYEPYTGGEASPNPDYPQEITNVTGDVEVKVQNKNLFDKTKVITTNLGNWGVEQIKNGIRVIHKNVYTTGRPRIVVQLKPNTTYTYSQNEVAGYSILPDGGTIKYASTNQMTVTTGNLGTLTIEYIVDSNSTREYTNIQLEEGSTATDYVEHKEQVLPLTLGNIELCKIRDYQDYFYKESNKWYLHKEIGKVLFDGDESFNELGQNDNGLYMYAFTKDDMVNAYNKKVLLCNYFTSANNYIELVSTSSELVGIFSTSRINFCTKLSSLNDWKSWLSTHNTSVYYPLATPTDTEITDATLIPQLEEISKTLSYEEQTNISSNQNALFSVEAYQDSKVILAEKYVKPSTGIPKTDLASAVQTSLNKADSAIQEHQDISGKQDITDNTLTTINKTVPTAINEVNSIAKLANQAKSYSTYQAFINYLNTAEKTEFIPGQSFMIQTKLVPDLWVYSVENTSVQYTYTTDEDFITYTNQATGGQVGYYKLAQLETQKVDLTNYVTFDDYATSTTAGVVKTNSMYGVSTSSYTQNITATTKTYDQYQSSNNATFVGKGTLENVITGKNLESANNKTTTISSSSTDNEYPSAKAVYDYIQSILNN